MDVLHTLSVGLAAVCIAGIIAWGANSCAFQETALREACIKSGASVVRDGQSFHCLRLGGTTGRD
jgi:hypothetical protein